MSSRNAYLSADERERALSLSLAPRVAREKHRTGACCVEEIVHCARRVLKRTPGVEVEYVASVYAETLAAHPPLRSPILVAIAARVGKTRLIDNTVLAPS
jgi:pantoate--beta-alanine ligase